MTELEKALSGQLYNACNPQLESLRKKCKAMCFKYNSLPPWEEEAKAHIIKGLFKSTGKNFVIEPNFYCDYGFNITIGENFYSNHNLVILDCANVTIGDNVFIAPNCGIYTAGHPIDFKTRNIGLEYARPITIKNNVWIGANTAILPGVTIGEGCVIAAGSVVKNDIPPNVIAAGNPCAVVKKIAQK